MLLSRVRLVQIGPFDDLSVSLVDARGAPRRVAVLFGGEGVGKTSVLSAAASTRPGHATAQLRRREGAAAAFVVTDWLLGDDDPARVHPLRVASPGAKLDEPEEAAQLRRREQALFERRAAEGGFVLAAFSGARWFSRAAAGLSAPERTVLRHDVRAAASFDDPARTDLTRETKQVLAFATIAAALARGGAAPPPDVAARLSVLEQALHSALAALLEGTGCGYAGVDSVRLEPMFDVGGGRRVPLEDLGRSARHLVAIGALTLRALAAARPERDPLEGEGVALVDDLEAQQDAHRQHGLVGRLRRALPRVQWIVATSSPAVASGAELSEVIALRRETPSGEVVLSEGADAVLH